MKNCIGGGNLVLTQAEGPNLIGWHFVSYLMALLSSSLSQWMNEVQKCGGSVCCVGGTQEQLMHNCWVGSWRLEQCQLFLPSAVLQHWRGTWTLHSYSHPLQQDMEEGASPGLQLWKESVACAMHGSFSLFPTRSAVISSQYSPSLSQSKVYSQTFWCRESLAEDLCPLILQWNQAVTARGF